MSICDVSAKFVLTAASCEYDLHYDNYVVVGVTSYNVTDSKLDSKSRSAYRAVEFIRHEKYYRNPSERDPAVSMRNDIALVRMHPNSPIRYGELVAPIKLQRRVIDSGVAAVTSGFENYVSTHLHRMREITILIRITYH